MSASIIVKEKINKKFKDKTFNYQEVYKLCLPIMEKKYPNNKNLKPKIRQILQMLRDKGFLKTKIKSEYFITGCENNEWNV